MSIIELKEKILLNLIFPIADFVMGTCAMKWYKKIQYLETLSKDELEQWQLKQLNLLLNHAYENTIYYKEVFDSLGIKPSDIKSFEDLKQIPVLTREIIKERFNDLIPRNINKIKHRYSSTGGSTGEPLRYICDENTWGFVTAMKIHSWQTTGYRYGELFMSLGSSSLFPVNKKSIVHEIYFKLKNTIPLNGMNMEDSICERYINIINKYNIKYIYGYATAIYLLALYCKKNNIDIKLKYVYTTAEKLHPHYRETIKESFKCNVMDCYGSKDGGVTAYEVEPGIYHVGYCAHFEKSDHNNQPQTLYVTNLIDFAFPTIRYANGDEVQMHDESIESNYNGQKLKEVIGRTSDIIELSNGHRLTTPGFTILFRKFNVNAYRIRKIGELEILIQIVKKDCYTEQEHELLCQAIQKHVGEDCTVRYEFLDKIEPLKNGKRSFFMNE